MLVPYGQVFAPPPSSAQLLQNVLRRRHEEMRTELAGLHTDRVRKKKTTKMLTVMLMDQHYFPHQESSERARAAVLAMLLRRQGATTQAHEPRPAHADPRRQELQALAARGLTRRVLQDRGMVSQLNTAIHSWVNNPTFESPRRAAAAPAPQQPAPAVGTESEVRPPIPPRVERLLDPEPLRARQAQIDSREELNQLVARHLVSGILNGGAAVMREGETID